MESVKREAWNREGLSPEVCGRQDSPSKQLRWWVGHFSLGTVTIFSIPHIKREASGGEPSRIEWLF